MKDGSVVEFLDRKFKLSWREIKMNQPAPSAGLSSNAQRDSWPQRRSSHSMTLFMNRYLVVIGGESPIDAPEGDKQNQKDAQAKEKGNGQLQIEDKT